VAAVVQVNLVEAGFEHRQANRAAAERLRRHIGAGQRIAGRTIGLGDAIGQIVKLPERQLAAFAGGDKGVQLCGGQQRGAGDLDAVDVERRAVGTRTGVRVLHFQARVMGQRSVRRRRHLLQQLTTLRGVRLRLRMGDVDPEREHQAGAQGFLQGKRGERHAYPAIAERSFGAGCGVTGQGIRSTGGTERRRFLWLPLNAPTVIAGATP
jgi:hypothetical protein